MQGIEVAVDKLNYFVGTVAAAHRIAYLSAYLEVEPFTPAASFLSYHEYSSTTLRPICLLSTYSL